MNQAIEGGQSTPEQSWGQVVTKSLQTMQDLMAQQRGPVYRYGPRSAQDGEIQQGIETAAMNFINAFPETNWYSPKTYLERFVPRSYFGRIDHEISAARKRKDESERARKLLESV